MTKSKDPKDPKDQKSIKKLVKRMLPCKLDQAGLAKLAEELGANLDKIAALEERKKAEADSIKGDIGLLDEATSLLRDKIRSKSVEREVQCEEVTDYRACEVRVTRLDTKETFSKRAMAKEELQLPLDAQKPGGKDRSEVKDVKSGGTEEPERKYPQAGNTIEVETRSGWKSGKVLPISGSVLDVDVGEEAPVQAPIDSQMWRWPGEGKQPLTTVGEVAAANEGEKKGRKGKGTVDPETGKPLPF